MYVSGGMALVAASNNFQTSSLESAGDEVLFYYVLCEKPDLKLR